MSNLPKIADIVRANLRKWQGESVQSRQFIQSSEEVPSFNKSTGNDEMDSDLTINSTPSAHMARCFSDSSQNSPMLPGNKVVGQDPPSVKTNRPFLRKRSGLSRYMSKPAHRGENTETSSLEKGETLTYSQFNSDFNPKQNAFIRKAKTSHVRFKEPEVNDDNGIENEQLETEPLHFTEDAEESDSVASKDIETIDLKKIQHLAEEERNVPNQDEQLAEFELLENYAQNTSFNSDSSVVQRALRNEPLQVKRSKEDAFQQKNMYREPEMPSNKRNLFESPFKKLNVSGLRQKLLLKERNIENLVEDSNKHIYSLERKMTQPLDDSIDPDMNQEEVERCSTPLQQSSNDVPPNNSIADLFNAYKKEEILDIKDKCDTQVKFADNEVTSIYQNVPMVEKSLLKEKIAELEKEIKIYQEQNETLSDLSKETQEISRKLKKEYDEIEKYKTEEKNKLESYIESERRQLQRQKETFNRFQKLRKENPTRKEREEIATLRHEVAKLKKELTQQRIKSTNDNKRMKAQLIEAEKERDCLKLRNMALEEQCQDLLDTFKIKYSGTKKRSLNNISNDMTTSSSNETKDTQNNNKTHLKCNTKTNSILKQPKVRFNLVPEFDRCSIGEQERPISDNSESSEADTVCGLETMPVSEGEENTPKPNKVVKTLPSGDTETTYPNGDKKIFSKEGIIKFMYRNGDVREIFPDKRQIYTFKDGQVEHTYPDGLQILHFTDENIEYQYPDGTKEVKFPNGSSQCMYSDGTVRKTDRLGNVLFIDCDGTETLNMTNGNREIRTKESVRREFPDGSVRILFATGRSEYRYSNGRIKLKDESGKVIIDTKYMTR